MVSFLVRDEIQSKISAALANDGSRQSYINENHIKRKYTRINQFRPFETTPLPKKNLDKHVVVKRINAEKRERK